MLFLRRALPALAFAVASTAAVADERILRYVSDVQIQRDSSLEVTETIDVNVEHDRINHGIYRDFPTRYRGRNGTQMHLGFTFENATLDGASVRASTEPSGNGVRIKIGDPDRLVDIGEHVYVLHYRTTRQIGRFPGFDELYWNATGNVWIFPIDVVEARIRLPVPVKFGQRAAYTGPQGSTASNAEVVEERPGEITFRTTQPLGPYEGLTVAAAFPKGVVAEPPPSSRLVEMLRDYGPPAVGLAGLLGMLFFYYVAWRRAGRDPRAGTIVPIFSPPDDLSPAGIRYVTKMASDNRTFAAALVDMGVKGHVRLVEEDRGWLSGKKTRLERLNGSTPLSEEEEAALDCLCRPGEEIMLEQKNHESFSSAKSALSGVLKARYEGKMFKRNLGWAAAGLLLFFAAMWAVSAAVVVATDGTSFWQIGVSLGSLLVAAFLWLALHDSSSVGKCLLSLIGVAAFAVAVTLGFPVLAEAVNSGWYLPLILPALAFPIVLSAFWWIAAPTKDGRAVLDHIAGFKQYLSITERERLDRMTPVNPPPDTPEVFEKYLPFAIALGVENRWADRFQGVLAAAAAHGQQGFAWYSGSSSPWSNPTGFVDNVGSSLSSAVGSASTAPGSSGGGSSGGGGGGGGGGGW
jgi:uncharacterized membrane protein YgcG